MKMLKSLTPNFIKQGISPLLNLYRRATVYRNRTIHLGGRLNGYTLQGGLLRGFLDGTYENQLCSIIEKNVVAGMTCVDIGAHVGYITLLFAKLTGHSGKVIAFEAHPLNAEYVRKNINQNGLSDYVHIENIAISDGNTPTVELAFGRMGKSAEWKIGNQKTRNTQISVPTTSLDAYFASSQKIDFIKMDIEGAETLAIPAMKQLLVKSRPLMCIEFHDETAWQTRQILIDADYQFYDIQLQQWLSLHDTKRVYHCFIVPKEKVNQVTL